LVVRVGYAYDSCFSRAGLRGHDVCLLTWEFMAVGIELRECGVLLIWLEIYGDGYYKICG
jgi:hypothetical protein